MTWMAWTWQTAAFFIFIAVLLATMGAWEYFRPGGAPRKGVFGLHTTRGDRLFITLLGSAFIYMFWLAFAPAYLVWAAVVSLAWAYFVFRYV